MIQVRSKIGRIAVSLIFCGAALAGAPNALAQQKYPDHAVRLIVPFPPGGQTDTVARMVGKALGPILGEQLIVDNRSGAAGSIGSGECARSKPDGYTLLIATTSTHAINPTAMKTVAYDPVKDFTPITVLGTGPIALSVHPSVPARTLKQLVAAAKARPGEYYYGSSGIASINHLAGELLKERAGRLNIVHVPYKGAGASLTDLVGGQIMIAFTTLSAALPHFRQGRVRALAVLKEERSLGAPDIPTALEAGIPGAVAYTFNILLAPAGTPQSVVRVLDGATRNVMHDRSFVQGLVRVGVDPISDSGPGKAEAMIRDEIRKWTPLIKSLGLGQTN